MGFDQNRIKYANESNVSPQLVCPICSGVFDDPIEIRTCEHSFCRKCIVKWLPYENVCYVCRKPATQSDLKSAPRIILIFLSGFPITCDFAPNGCEEVIKLDQLPAHVKRCQFNPDLTLRCPKNCGAILKRIDVEDAFPAHECVSYLLSQAKEGKDDKTKMGLVIGVIDHMQEKMTLQQKTIVELCAKIGLKNADEAKSDDSTPGLGDDQANSGLESLATSYYVKVVNQATQKTGLDRKRFKGDVHPQLICPICSDVFNDPYEISNCEHSFCKKCITKWLSYEQVCNVCRQPVTESDLEPAPKITRSLLGGLLISCDFAQQGCKEYVKLDQLSAHVERCHLNCDPNSMP